MSIYLMRIRLDHSDQSKVPDRRAGFGRNLHERRARPMGSTAKDLDPCSFVVQLALPNQLLTSEQKPFIAIQLAERGASG